MKTFFIVICMVVVAGCESRDGDGARISFVDAGLRDQAKVSAKQYQDGVDKNSAKGRAQAPKPVGKIKCGLRQGPWTFFHANGKKAAQGGYVDGLKDGQWIFWYDTGKKTAEGSFHMGKKVGTWVEYDQMGQKISEQTYADGLRVYR